MAPSGQKEDLSSSGKTSLKKRIKNQFSRYHGQEEGLEIRKLEMFKEHKNAEEKVQKLSLGQKTNCPTKVILLVGATGTGKTTLINAMVNYIYCVDFTDDFRFILIDDKDAPKRENAESQTDLITAYVFYQLPQMPFDYNYVLIDTPGFGDTRGIQRDRELMRQLEAFFKQDYGIDHVDGVGFVTPASAARLTQTQRYVYDGLSSMFGRDIQDNIFIMATFADAKTPPVLETLKKAEVQYKGCYKFNNSALFAQNREILGDDSETDSDGDDDDSLHISKLFWDMGYRSLNNFFVSLAKITPASLTLTKEVLEERNHLQVVIIGLQKLIHLGLGKLGNLNQERKMLARIDDDMKGCANYTEKIEVPKITKHDLMPKTHVTNCVKCNFTCHYPCSRRDDAQKKKCWAMTDGYCRICPAKCFWEFHKNMKFRYEHKWIKEQRTIQELLDRYNLALEGKTQKESVVRAIEDDINQHAQMLIKIIQEAQKCVERLEEIALKPNPLSTKEYIDLMIESEKMQKRHNFRERIKMLETLKEEVGIVQGVRGVCNQNSGESLLQYFQNYMS